MYTRKMALDNDNWKLAQDAERNAITRQTLLDLKYAALNQQPFTGGTLSSKLTFIIEYVINTRTARGDPLLILVY